MNVAIVPEPGRKIESSSVTDIAKMTVDEVFAHFGTNRDGLTEREAKARLLRFGSNTLPRPLRTPWYLELAKNFGNLFAVLLWTAAGLAWLAGMPELAVAIVVVIVVNGLFSFWQQYRAERAIEALESLLPLRVTVRRGGAAVPVDAKDVVIGDLLLLAEGEAIPADARLAEAQRLRVDASSLTGESRPVPRRAERSAVEASTSAECVNVVLAGTTVAAGRGEAVVFATGRLTEFGRLAQLTHEQPRQTTTLERELAWITRLITWLSAALGAAFFLLGTNLAHLSAVEAFLFALGIIVANVPEGLLPTISLALALAGRRMAARNAIVKRLERVETLGAVTVIVSDKTGTLTKNQMTVRELWLPDVSYRVSGNGYEPAGNITLAAGVESNRLGLQQLLLNAALCCDAQLRPPPDGNGIWTALGDPTEAALLVAAAKAEWTTDTLQRYPRLTELPFDSLRKRMTTLQARENQVFACTKGAPSEVLAVCNTMFENGVAAALDSAADARINAAIDRLVRGGLRVLAVATRTLDAGKAHHDDWQLEEVERELTFLGLIAMEDPPRPEVPAAILACRGAGIRVVMSTGDDGRTAAAIGREIGLYGPDAKIVSGRELDRVNDAQLAILLGNPQILFARATPEHKLRVVEAFQRRGEVVAVTGDGVNDAPALRRADIGVAMGQSGTDVAREAADMILLDDNFNSIVAAIEEGRGVYDNIRKFTTYIFASNIPEIVPFILFILFRIPLPLKVMQILAVDLGTDLLPALALGAEPPEPRVMQRAPRPRDQKLLDWPALLRAYAWLGAIEAALCMTGYFAAYLLAGWRPGIPLPSDGNTYVLATTMSLAGIVAGQIGNSFACRSSHQSVWRLGLLSNRFLLLAIGAELAILVILIYTPLLARIFHLAPLGVSHWLILASFAPALLLLEELRKWVVRHWAGGFSRGTGA